MPRHRGRRNSQAYAVSPSGPHPCPARVHSTCPFPDRIVGPITPRFRASVVSRLHGGCHPARWVHMTVRAIPSRDWRLVRPPSRRGRGAGSDLLTVRQNWSGRLSRRCRTWWEMADSREERQPWTTTTAKSNRLETTEGENARDGSPMQGGWPDRPHERNGPKTVCGSGS